MQPGVSEEEIIRFEDFELALKSGELRNVMIDVQDAGQASVQAKALTTGTGDKIVLNMSAEQLKSQAKKSGKQAQSQGQGASTGGASKGGATTGGTGDAKLPSSGGGK